MNEEIEHIYIAMQIKSSWLKEFFSNSNSSTGMNEVDKKYAIDACNKILYLLKKLDDFGA